MVSPWLTMRRLQNIQKQTQSMCHSCPLHFAVAKMLLLRLTIVHPVLWDQAGENKRGTKHYFWAAKRRHSESDPPTSRTLTLLLSLVENMLSRANVMLGWLLACQIPVDKLSAPNIVTWRHLFLQFWAQEFFLSLLSLLVAMKNW